MLQDISETQNKNSRSDEAGNATNQRSSKLEDISAQTNTYTHARKDYIYSCQYSKQTSKQEIGRKEK